MLWDEHFSTSCEVILQDYVELACSLFMWLFSSVIRFVCSALCDHNLLDKFSSSAYFWVRLHSGFWSGQSKRRSTIEDLDKGSMGESAWRGLVLWPFRSTCVHPSFELKLVSSHIWCLRLKNVCKFLCLLLIEL